MQTKIRLMVVYLLASTGAPLLAQHVDILVYDNAGKIGVGEYNFDTLTATERRVHLARFDNLYSIDNPGFTSLTGPDALPGNQDLSWSFLPMTVHEGPHAGYRSTLLYWDGTGDPTFGPTSTDEYEFSIFGQFGSAAATGSDNVEAGSVIAPTPPNGSIHEHPFYFLDDNGDGLNTTIPDAGIYLLSMNFDITGLETSDPVFMVWATPEFSVLPAIQPAAAWVNARVDSLVVDSIAGDFDSDGGVDGADFLTWQQDSVALGGAAGLLDWNTSYTAGASTLAAAQVPETTTLRGLVLAVTIVQAMRRNRYREHLRVLANGRGRNNEFPLSLVASVGHQKF